jgi:Rrf2 family protein
MLSKKCKYAIRAVLFIATNADERRMGGQAVAESLRIPKAFTFKILQELARKDIISSVKGPGGGFFISEDNKSTTLFDIIIAIDGPEVFKTCSMGLNQCSDQKPCPVHEGYKKVTKNLIGLYSKKNIAELSLEIVEKEFYLVN